MISLIFTASIALVACPETILVGFDIPLQSHEQESLDHAKKRCVQLNYKLPCLKKFEKKSDRSYWAICGK